MSDLSELGRSSSEASAVGDSEASGDEHGRGINIKIPESCLWWNAEPPERASKPTPFDDLSGVGAGERGAGERGGGERGGGEIGSTPMPVRQAERRSQWPSSAKSSQGGGGGGGGRGPSRPAVTTPATVSTVQRKPLAVSATLGRLMSTTAARHRRAQLPDTPHPPPPERDITPAPSRPHPPPPAAVAVSARALHTSRLPLSHSAPNTRMPAPSRPPPPPPPPPAVAVSARAPNTSRPPLSARPPPAPTSTPANPPATSLPAHAGTNTPFGSVRGARQTYGQHGSLGRTPPPPPPRRAPPDLPRVGGSSAVRVAAAGLAASGVLQMAGSVTGGAAAGSSWAQPSKEAGAAEGASRGGVRVSSSSSYMSALPAPSTRLTLANAEANAQTSRASAPAVPAAAPRLTRTRPDTQTKFEAQRYAPNSKDTQAQAHAQNISQYGPSLPRDSGA